jgi:rare lipoprotein A
MVPRIAFALVAVAACRGEEEPAQRPPPAPVAPAMADAGPPDERVTRVYRGKAIWYGGKWHGKKTASGEIFDKGAMTAAHRNLPFDTRLRVTNLENDRQAIVRINDRGPYGADRSRIIDVSEAAAQVLGFAGRGWIRVELEVLAPPSSWWSR